MKEIELSQSLKKKTFLLTCFVLYSLYILEGVFAHKQWNSDYVQVNWVARCNSILITTIVYDYLFGPKSEHGYLRDLRIEASVDGRQYYRIMDIATPRQVKSEKTMIYLKNKLSNAIIRFLDTGVTPYTLRMWPDNAIYDFRVLVCNTNSLAAITLGWDVAREYRDISYIRVSGIWQVDAPYQGMFIDKHVFRVHIPALCMLKSNLPCINTKVYKNDPVKLINESEGIVINGANLGANIKVYTASGAEIKSVISNNEVVKIKLPTHQIYLVHIGESRYKVCL